MGVSKPASRRICDKLWGRRPRWSPKQDTKNSQRVFDVSWWRVGKANPPRRVRWLINPIGSIACIAIKRASKTNCKRNTSMKTCGGYHHPRKPKKNRSAMSDLVNTATSVDVFGLSCRQI